MTISLLVHASKIEGAGVFAGAHVNSGEVIDVVNVSREVTPAAPLNVSAGERADHCAYLGDRVFLWGEPHCRLNHSCSPNAYESHREGQVVLIARRDISAGEEVSLDYNINLAGGEPWDCRCGSARCLKKCPADYFKLPADRRREYESLLNPWFCRLHADRLGAATSESLIFPLSEQ